MEPCLFVVYPECRLHPDRTFSWPQPLLGSMITLHPSHTLAEPCPFLQRYSLCLQGGDPLGPWAQPASSDPVGSAG